MGFDLDPLDDLFSDGAVKNGKLTAFHVVLYTFFTVYGRFSDEFLVLNVVTARTGAKFQPKAKARPRKAPPVSVPSSQPSQTASITEHPLTETIRTEEPSGKNEGYFHESVNDNNSLGLVNSSPECVASKESVGPLVGPYSDAVLHDSSGHGNSCLGKMEEEVNFMFLPHVVFIPKKHGYIYADRDF